jgi:redox-sensitive bicupin YhaK (pirin superfamily)
MKNVSFIRRGGTRHWVGDGFPAQTIFLYTDTGAELSPFLLLDYVGPTVFAPTEQRRGVGPHPHRGFETVTLVYSGEVEHRDSTGGGGTIGPGDVQWMTAASGIVHEEFHSRAFAEKGGAFEMIQLWVNLPAKDKMAPPAYQTLTRAAIPKVELPGGAGTVRVVAGDFDGHEGPARTFTPIDLWDIRLGAGSRADLRVPSGHTTALLVVGGQLRLETGAVLDAADLAVLDRSGDMVSVEALADAKLLLLAGEPIDEPIVGEGPFVMNTESQIGEAFADYRAGRLGRLPAHA